MPKKKSKKKKSIKKIHYVQLRTHRKWPNETNYFSHLNIFQSKIQPITYNINRILNNKWIDIQRPKLIKQLNQDHIQDIQKDFLHQTNLFDYKFTCLNNQFDENNQFLRRIFIRSIEITDYLLYLYQQIEFREKQIYEYRLDIIKYEFEKEKQNLKYLFIDQEFKEFDNQIDILNLMEQEYSLQQFIQFKLQKRKLEEQFFKDINILHLQFNTQIISLKSTINQIIHSNNQQININSKNCHNLYKKIYQGKERIDQEKISINILQRKIKEIKKYSDNIEQDRIHINDKLNHLKQCSDNHQSKNQEEKQTKKKILIFSKNQNQIIFRRLSVLINNIQKDCQKKLSKAEHLFFLINQCQKLELDDEKLLLSLSTKININQLKNQIISQIHYLHNCQFEFNSSSFDELSLFWKRFSHKKNL